MDKIIDLVRLPGYDVNGNPRYVCHYLNFLTEKEKGQAELFHGIVGKHTAGYWLALARSRKIGGKAYRAKWYGGGVVFTSYENVLRRDIAKLMEEAEKEQEA